MEGLVVMVLIGLFGIFRMVIRNAQEKERQAQRQQQMAGPDGQQQMAGPDHQRRVQSEIDSFLQEVGASKNKPPQRPVQQRTTGQQPPVQQRVPRQQRPPRKRRPRQTSAEQQESRQQARAQTAPRRTSVADRTIAREVGSGIDRHVESYMAHADSSVADQAHLDIVQSVETHLGRRDLEMPGSVQVAEVISPAESLRNMLRSAGGAQQAILLNEVLSRPRTLRR